MLPFCILDTGMEHRCKNVLLCMLNITPPICEVDEEVCQSGNDHIGDIIGEHEEEDKDPVSKVGSAHSVSFRLPLTSVGEQN